jgi:signal transduction histidine kinase
VTVQGQDELSELAAGIDEMRRSILRHQQAEDEIRSANSQLVTAMSHDLRTPLTSLLAFLEILDRDKVQNEEQRRHLISQCLTKTMSIKAMADKLFEYFLVYTSEWEQPELETCDADEVFTQFWQEYAFTLESHGFAVEMDFGELGGKVAVNLELLRRAFDNLYANLVKYAEPSKPVQIACHREDDQVLLTISNAVSSQRDNRESTNIGLNTCRRIMKMLGGSFETNEADGVFTVKLRLPFS